MAGLLGLSITEKLVLLPLATAGNRVEDPTDRTLMPKLTVLRPPPTRGVSRAT